MKRSRFWNAEPLFEDYQVIYEDQGLIVVNKPPGIASTGLQVNDPYCLQSVLCDDYHQWLWAVHQLDADTSGILLFVKKKELVKHYKDLMELRSSRKTYLALCHGVSDFEEIYVKEPIGRLKRKRKGGHNWGLSAKGKSASSRVRTLQKRDGYTLFSVEIETGRMHQIRIHMAFLGHPLLGEDWYREPACEVHKRQALHAYKMRLSDGKELKEFRAPLWPDLHELFERLGFHDVEGDWFI